MKCLADEPHDPYGDITLAKLVTPGFLEVNLPRFSRVVYCCHRVQKFRNMPINTHTHTHTHII